MSPFTVSADRYAAVVFDLDGVLTDTASVHLASWRSVFDELLAAPGPGRRDPFTDEDYLRYVDGRRRYDGAAAFLASRGIDLPWGDPGDPPAAMTVCGIGNHKDEVFGQWLTAHHVPAYPDALRFLDRLASAGIRRAVVSASRNCTAVLASAGLSGAFEVQVDGVVADRLALPGKPDPATFLHAAQQLGAPADRCVVVEDAESGVRAGRAGGFGLVVGIVRTRRGAPDASVERAAALRAAGADVVVADLDELAVTGHHGASTGSEPSVPGERSPEGSVRSGQRPAGAETG